MEYNRSAAGRGRPSAAGFGANDRTGIILNANQVFNVDVKMSVAQAGTTVQVTDADNIMVITNKGMLIRMPARDISVIGRNTQGVRLIDIGEAGNIEQAAGMVESLTPDLLFLAIQMPGGSGFDRTALGFVTECNAGTVLPGRF